MHAPQQAQPTEPLDLDRMARRLRVPKKWLREHADAGEIPVLRVGGRYFFSERAVLAAIEAKAAKSVMPKAVQS